MKPIRLLVLTRYGSLGASSRLRFFQYLSFLESAGFNADVQSLFNDVALSDRYRLGRYKIFVALYSYLIRAFAMLRRSKYDILWIEKEALPLFPYWLEAMLLKGVPYVLDYDDAVFHNYDMHRSSIIRLIYGNRLDELMAKSVLVVAGNEYIATRAKEAGAKCIEILPTVIDKKRYSMMNFHNIRSKVPCIVWIGSPSTAKYLKILQKPLAELASQFKFTVRMIGAQMELPGVDVEYVPWSESTEVRSIAECDIGVMPLHDTPWERGKCGYKLIQYMACRLPVVASPVGANNRIVKNGVTGFLANSNEEWAASLAALLTSIELRKKMGIEGRISVESEFCVQVQAPRLVNFFIGIHGENKKHEGLVV